LVSGCFVLFCCCCPSCFFSLFFFFYYFFFLFLYYFLFFFFFSFLLFFVLFVWFVVFCCGLVFWGVCVGGVWGGWGGVVGVGHVGNSDINSHDVTLIYFASMTATMATNLTFAIVVQKSANNILLTVKSGNKNMSCDCHKILTDYKLHGCTVTVCRKFVKGGAAITYNVRGCTAADILSS